MIKDHSKFFSHNLVIPPSTRCGKWNSIIRRPRAARLLTQSDRRRIGIIKRTHIGWYEHNYCRVLRLPIMESWGDLQI